MNFRIYCFASAHTPPFHHKISSSFNGIFAFKHPVFQPLEKAAAHSNPSSPITQLRELCLIFPEVGIFYPGFQKLHPAECGFTGQVLRNFYQNN